MEETIDLADDGKFSDFSQKIRQSLGDKLKNHPTIKQNAQDLEKFNNLKKIYDQATDTQTPKPEDSDNEIDNKDLDGETGDLDNNLDDENQDLDNNDDE